jgi:plasmid stabilization system protein ParE
MARQEGESRMKDPRRFQRILKTGVKSHDLRQAVESARELTEQTEAFSGLAETVLSRLARHPRIGKRTRAVVVVAAKTAATLRMATAAMLEPKDKPK